MNTKEEAKESKFSTKDFTPIPVIMTTLLVLYFGVSFAVNGEIGNDGYAEILILPMAAAIASAIGRISPFLPMEQMPKYRTMSISLGIVLVAFLLNIISPSNFNNIFIVTFVLVGILSVMASQSKHFEESNLLLSMVIGFHLAVSFASNLSMDAGLDINSQRTSIGIAFISFWIASISVGFTLAMYLRGTLDHKGNNPFFSVIPVFTKNKSVVLFSSLISLVYIIPLLQFENNNSLGIVWAISTSLIVIFYAFCRSERWFVLGAIVAINWFIYTLGHIQEIGNTFYPDVFEGEGFLGAFSWFFITFWLNIAAISLASKGYFGDIAPMRTHGKFRIWWNANFYNILIPLSFLVALTVRVVWNVVPAMNASGTGLWDMSGGSDPWYMKRVIDYIVVNNSHLIFDADRAYPMGAINPRPPLFTWSLALGGMALSWVLESDNTGEVVWWSLSSLPAIYGALIIFPVSGIANRIYGKKAAILSAWLIAFMPGHISRSTFGMVDHDSFAILLLSTAFYFWITSLSYMEQERIFKKTSANPLYIIAGIRESWVRNPKVMANATLSGIAFAIMALGWKGFVYGPAIIFLVFSLQLLLNLFRSRDSIQLTSANLQMLFTTLIIALPFYAWPGLNLVLNPNGLEPLFFIIGFSLILGWVTCSFRDKPWLLVLGVGTTLVSLILLMLFLLQEADIYAGWDILFTGGFYFDKNKIFGTIGEAQAPSRGVLFASYGPIVALIALSYAFVFLWRGARSNKGAFTLLGSWGIISTYMAWSAGRFIINATPIMAILGGIGIAMLWKSANFSNFSKEWRNSGIGTPRARFRSLWPASKSQVGVPILAIVFMLVFSQHVTYGIDSGIPRGSEYASDVDQAIYDLTPDILRTKLLGEFSILDSSDYNYGSPTEFEYIGTFGPSFNSYGWNDAFSWLESQDSDVGFSERPAFVSWWDYGFSALTQGQHPTVADNFQSGIPHSGGMLLSQGQDDTIALFITTLTQGDMKANNGIVSDLLLSTLSYNMNEAQIKEYSSIMSNTKSSFVIGHAMQVRAIQNGVELLSGYQLNSEGIPSQDLEWVVVSENGDRTSLGDNKSAALSLFNQTRGSASVSSSLSSWDEGLSPSYYDIGNYRYTTDLIEDFDSASTSIHKTNSKLAISRAFLVSAFDIDALVDIYHDISTSITYEVQDYDGPLGSTVERNNEIRYFAVDNKLYPLGGSYYEDYSYHRGQTTGIFHAPTGLSGLDMNNYISTLYLTQRGDGPIVPRSSQEFNDAYLSDLELQQSGAISDSTQVIRYTDIDYQHKASFFDTMVARTYVGYGTSTLGLQGDAESPSVWFNPQSSGLIGAPGTYLQNAWALPGAMMNHMVISNWYDSDYDDDGIDNIADLTKCGDLIESNITSNLSIGDTSISLVDASLMPISGSANLNDDIEVQWTGKSDNSLTGVSKITKDIKEGSQLSYNPDRGCGSIYDSNRFVKILKYYSGATLEGTVSLDGDGIVPNARILVERDAFSGDETADSDGNVVDRDGRTYWIPIGYSDADENGKFSLTVPAGKIRISAYIGDTDLDSARASIMTSDVGQTMFELVIEENTQRMTNPITGILGNVAGATWLSETIVNVSGSEGHSNGEEKIQVSIDVSSSSSSGVLSWAGSGDFNGQPIENAQIVLSPSSELIALDPYLISTSNGTVTGDDLQFQGLGEVLFTGAGNVVSPNNILSVYDFTGQHTQDIYNNHSIIGDGLFTGKGLLSNGVIKDDIEIFVCQDDTLPEGVDICINNEENYLLNGTYNASGKFTSVGKSTFTKTLIRSTLIGSGTFTVDTTEALDSYGIVNGTGTFSGTGIFSGAMVQPGTFRVVNAIPGTYDVSVIFGDGTQVNLTNQFTIPLRDSPSMSMPVIVFGGTISGHLIDSNENVVNSSVSLIKGINSIDQEMPVEDCSIIKFAPCFIYPDDTGKISFGPITPGSYLAEIDSDGDGIPEVSMAYDFNVDTPFDAIFPSPLPETSDIRFTLIDEGIMMEDLNISFYYENQINNIVNALYDADSKEYNVELTQGTWILSHSLDENKQIWKSIVIGSEDLEMEIEFEVSKLVSGLAHISSTDLITDNSIITPLPNHPVSFYWGEELTTIVYTNLDGEFEVTLPVNSIVDASLQYSLDLPYSSNYRFTVNDVLDDNQTFNLTAEKSLIVNGKLSLDIIGNYYTNSLDDWSTVQIIATPSPLDDSKPSWRATVDETGNFQMFLKEGDWIFSKQTSLNNPSNILEEVLIINESVKDIDLLLYSDISPVIIDLFLDHSRDGNISNGTMVQYPFAIKSLNPLIPTYEVAIDGDEWVSYGRAEVYMAPGTYSIVIDRANPSDGDLFDTLYTSDDSFDIGLIVNEFSTSIAFEPEWLTNLTLTNQSGGILSNQLVRFKDIDSGWLLSFMSNSNGSISTYIPEGEWLVTIDSLETNTDVFESIRRLISVTNISAGQSIDLITNEVAKTTIILTNGEIPLSNVQLKLISETLGTTNSPYSDELGMIDLKIEPGMWDVELNYTDNNGVMWIIETTPLLEEGLSAGENSGILLNVSKFVQLKGTVFWDLNNNNLPNFGEGVLNASVNLTSDLQSELVVTDELGAWSIYLPHESIWSISTHIDGFSDAESTVSLSNDSHVKNIQITAGVVEISGFISYIDENQFQEIADEITIVLLPASGIIRDRVTPNKILNDQMIWDGEWSVMVEPGDWIAWITAESTNNVPYLVSIDYMDVGINGLVTNSEMSIGGKLILDTQWLDYDGNDKSLLDLVSHNVIINLRSLQISWDEQLNENGTLELILPIGQVDASSSFNYSQEGMVMDYSGGKGATIRSSQDTPVTTLEITVIKNQDILITNAALGNADLVLSDMPCTPECTYDAVDFNLNLNYIGHQSYDNYTVNGIVPGADGVNWTVEFKDDSGNWNSSTSVEMGLENTLSINDFEVRITPAKVNTAHHLNNGHQIRIIFTTLDGYVNEHVIIVNVPQSHAFSSDGFSKDIYGIVPDELFSIDIGFLNEGNGDDIFFFDYSIDSLDDWTVSGIRSQPVAPFANGLTSVSIIPPGNISEDQYTLTLIVTDENNNTYGPYSTIIQKSKSILSLSTDSKIQLLSGDSGPISGEIATYLIEVKNTGLIPASSVELNAVLCSDILCNNYMGINGSSMYNIPAEGSSTFYIDMDFTNIKVGKYFVQFYFTDILRVDDIDLESCNALSEDSTECTMEAQTLAAGEDTDRPILGYIMGLLLIVTLLYIISRSTRRPGAPF